MNFQYIKQKKIINMEKNMQIREAKNEDIEQIVVILEQISKMHYEKRPDIFKKKSKNEIRKNAIEIMNNKKNKINITN